MSSENKSHLKVLFGDRAASKSLVTPNTVLIVPSSDDWNDFTLRTRIDCIVQLQKTVPPFRWSGLLGFLDSKVKSENGDQFESLRKSVKGKIIPAGSMQPFFTMLPSMEAYRRVVQQLTQKPATDVFRAIHDLVALGEFDPASTVLNEAISTEVFALSFMRETDTYFAFKNAGSILHGLEFEKTGLLSDSLAIRFRLPGRENDHDLKFQFDHKAELPKTIAVIIGKNGVGKSQTLARIARAAIDGSEALSDGTEGGRPSLNRLLAFAPTNEAESVFPSDRRKHTRIWYRRFSMNRARKARRHEYVSDLVIQVARSPAGIANRARWEIFWEGLNAIPDRSSLHLISSTSPGKYVPLTNFTGLSEQAQLERYAAIDVTKEPVRVVDGKAFPLSSGEISFLKFAAQASLHIENGSLLLLDEPETHLHPNFISRFVSILDTLLALTGSAAIIATHSVYFIREVFREQVTVLSTDADNVVQAQCPTLRTFGADVGAISYFVFGEDEPTRLAKEIQELLLATKMSWEGILEKYKSELSLELLSSLREKRQGTESQ